MAPHPGGLVVYALAMAAMAMVVLLAERERGFPLALSRRAGAIVLSLNAMLALIALGADEDVLRTPGWMMSLALLGAANLVAGLGILLRAVSMPSWLRVLTGTSSLLAPLVLAALVVPT